MGKKLIRVTEKWEMRFCNLCGCEVVRERRVERRYGEMRCLCRGESFTIFDPVWVARDTGDLEREATP
jgi:hypothetical protein